MSENEGIDIGHGVTMRYVTVDGEPGGILVEHPVVEGEPFYGDGIERGASAFDRCCGAVLWRGDSALHSLVSLNPLSITPSIQCREHRSFHGYITNGGWVPV